jgi:hypothetical protein
MTPCCGPVATKISATPYFSRERNSQAIEAKACCELLRESHNTPVARIQPLVNRILATAYRECGYGLPPTPQFVSLEGWPR